MNLLNHFGSVPKLIHVEHPTTNGLDRKFEFDPSSIVFRITCISTFLVLVAKGTKIHAFGHIRLASKFLYF